MVMWGKVEKLVDWNRHPTVTGYPLSFQDAFVEDDQTRTWVMRDVKFFRDWRTVVVEESLDSFPVGPSGTVEHRAKRELEWCKGMEQVYGWIKGFLQQTNNNLLEMLTLCSEVKPETLALVKRYCRYEDLDRSMLMMKPEPRSEGFPFEEPRGLEKS